MSARSLTGSVVVVTGGSRGIGRAIAEACAKMGASVVAGSRSRSGFPADVRQGEIVDAELDVTDERSVTAFFAWLDRLSNRLDALVNNAGVGVWKPIDAISLDEWRAVIDTNLTGVFLCSREALRRMKSRDGGRIVTIGSVADRLPIVDCGAYGASKYGARGFTEVLTEEGKHFGVLATQISLGAVATTLWNGREGFTTEDMLAVTDVADAVVNVLVQPAHVRIDEVRLAPRKGLL